MDDLLPALKIKLQSLGALRPEAWERIVQLSQQQKIATGGNFIRKEGALAYVASGILKEHDHYEREEPAIVNFIGQHQCFVTRRHHQNRYLIACAPTMVFHWDFANLQDLYLKYPELKRVHEALCEEYDEISAFRSLILEEHSAKARIRLFLTKYQALVPMLKKKDMAKYMQMSYNHFLKAYNHFV